MQGVGDTTENITVIPAFHGLGGPTVCNRHGKTLTIEPGTPMFDNVVTILDWLGIIVFAVTGALVASRNRMDIVGFVLLGVVTGIGGGTIRDLLLDIHPLIWIEQPTYLLVCAAASLCVFSRPTWATRATDYSCGSTPLACPCLQRQAQKEP